MPAGDNIAKAAKALKTGKVVIIPTETVYGLAADAFNEKAVRKIFRLKKRSAGAPLQVLIADIRTARLLFKKIPEKARKLIKRSWPGPLTLVMEKKGSVPGHLTAGRNTIGVRMPDHPVTLELIRRSGGIIAATSANISGKKPPRTAGEAKRHFKTGIGVGRRPRKDGTGFESCRNKGEQGVRYSTVDVCCDRRL